MTSDEARKLVGGYATGSLTEAERAALFRAALEDQELFDELAGEQVLKEVLDEPGARQRLIAALEPPRHRAWLWLAAAATAGLAIVVGVVVSQRTPPPPPQEIAQVMKSPEPVAAPALPPAAPPVPQRVPLKRKAAPVPESPPAPPPPPPPAESKKEDKVAAADQLQQARPQAAAGAVREFSALRAAARFAFNYTVRDGVLEIVPAAPGYLSVTANDAVLFPGSAVGPGMPIRIAIPSDASSLVIAFSGMLGITGSPVRRDGTLGTVTDQDPPNGRILIQLFLTPATQ